MLRIWATLWGAIGVMLAAHGLIAAPAENPPDDFTARQYIDSQGCVFLRDDSGEWQARQARDGQPVCGYPPTFSSRAGGGELAADSPSDDDIARNLLTQIVTTLGPEALETRLGVPAQPEADPRHKENGLMSAGPLEALNHAIALDSTVKHAIGEALRPNNRLCELLGGKSVISAPGMLGADPTQGFCGEFTELDFKRVPTSGSYIQGGTENEATLPVIAAAPVTDRSSATPAPQPQPKPVSPSRATKSRTPTATASSSLPKTSTAKATAQKPQLPVKARVLTIDRDQARPLPPIPRGARYVQVGVFRNAANAERSVAALQRLKLPLSRGKGQIKGRSVDIILAGPFDDPWKLAEAMRAVRASGYTDAYPR